MGKGKRYKDKQLRYTDEYSGREVVRLTAYLGHSNHLYFTDPCWLRGGRSLIFTSDRENQSNLFRYDLEDGVITQLTDLAGPGRPGGCYSAANAKHYFWWQGALREVDPETLDERIVCKSPPGKLQCGHGSPSADGKYVIGGFQEAPHAGGPPRISYSYSTFRESFRERPFTQLVRVDLATGEWEVIHEDRCFITHINTSPTRAELTTFCHEGPWDLVDQRMWGLNALTGELWKIRPQEDDVSVGHEYWFSDGERIGYHGRCRGAASEHVFGITRWDNTGGREAAFPFHSTHFHSLDERLIVGDGSPATTLSQHAGVPYIQLFRWNGERYEGPRVLAYHRSTFNNQHAHCHPRFSPDGRAVLYTSDLTAYSNLYWVEIGDFDELPDVESVLGDVR